MPQHARCRSRPFRLNLRLTVVGCALAVLGGCQSMPPVADLHRRAEPQVAVAGAHAPAAHNLPGEVPSAPDSPVTPPAATLSPAGDDKAPGSAWNSAEAPPPAKDLWQRLRRGMKLQPPAGVAVQRTVQHVRWYRDQSAHMQRTFMRARLYLHDIVEAVEREGMPMEIALLPAVESAFMPTARSSAAADGLWQFIAPTGRRFNLKQHMFQDDRRNVRAATNAALRYLKELQARYGGDYQLALAAYNCGEGNIDTAIRGAKARGLPGRFEDLNLVPETANYVPKLLALAQVVAAAVDLGEMDAANLPPMANAPYFAAVRVGRDIDVKLAAQLAGLQIDEFRALNAQHKTPVIVAASNPEVLVPVERQAVFEEALLNYRGPLATWGTAQVLVRSSVGTLAKRHGIDARTLRALNGIPDGHLVSGGSTLVVPRKERGEDIAAREAERAQVSTTPAIVQAVMQVERKENWAGLAARLGTTVAELRGWNPKLATLRAGTVRLNLPPDLAERLRRLPPPQKVNAVRVATLLEHKSSLISKRAAPPQAVKTNSSRRPQAAINNPRRRWPQSSA